MLLTLRADGEAAAWSSALPPPVHDVGRRTARQLRTRTGRRAARRLGVEQSLAHLGKLLWVGRGHDSPMRTRSTVVPRRAPGEARRANDDDDRGHVPRASTTVQSTRAPSKKRAQVRSMPPQRQEV